MHLQKHFLRFFILFAVVLTQVSFTDASTDCLCGKRSVMVYDFDVQVAKPDSATAQILWLNFFDLTGIVEAFLMNNDPLRECILYFDRHFKDKVLTFGWGYTVLAPEGPIPDNRQYILTGVITQVNESTYQANLEMQTSVSREVVKAISVQFPLNADSIRSAGKKIANELIPLRTRIEDFETKKKAANPAIIIGEYCVDDSLVLSIKPEKKTLKTGDSTIVSIKMIDCDGSPIAGHEIHFDGGTFQGEAIDGSTGGTVRPSSCITDANGNAQVTYIAGQEKMCAAITAWSPFVYPWGQEDGIIESEPVSIEAPVDLWAVKFTYSEYNEESDTTRASFVVNPTTNPVTSTTSSENQSRTCHFASGTILIIDKPSILFVDTNVIDIDVSEDSVVSYSARGSYRYYFMNRDMSIASVAPELRDYFLRTTDGRGGVTDSLSRSIYGSGFSFSYSKKTGSFSVSCKATFVRNRYTMEKSYDETNGWSDTTIDVVDTECVGYRASTSYGGTITISDSGFIITCDSTEADTLTAGSRTLDNRYLYVKIYKISPDSNSAIIYNKDAAKNIKNQFFISRHGRNISVGFNEERGIPQIEIFNAAGKSCSFQVKKTATMITYTGIPAGIYLIRIKSQNGLASATTQKVIVQ